MKEDAISVLQNSDEASFGDKIINYNNQMRRLIDFHAPLKTRKVKIVPQSQWFDNEYKELRKSAEKLKRKQEKSKRVRQEIRKMICRLVVLVVRPSL